MEIEFSAKLVCKMAFLHYDESKDAVFCHTCLMGCSITGSVGILKPMNIILMVQIQ